MAKGNNNPPQQRKQLTLEQSRLLREAMLNLESLIPAGIFTELQLTTPPNQVILGRDAKPIIAPQMTRFFIFKVAEGVPLLSINIPRVVVDAGKPEEKATDRGTSTNED